MKRVLFYLGSALLTLGFATSVSAKTAKSDGRTPASGPVHLTGVTAEEFVYRHFPNAQVPGEVDGKFNYNIRKKTGTADCAVPAMGERSDGDESTCAITEGSKHLTISGAAAEAFVERHFPNADIPGQVQGKFAYYSAHGTGHAKCFVPAMGGQSNGVEASCDITYN